ncbi:MAG: hypothetical protein Q4C75_05970 [Bergeyella zoohelcum]|nr:hypothetical protein [Bergeyella zoohelcum]
MNKATKLLASLLLTLSLSSCTVMKVSERKSDGYFSSVKQASTIKSEKIDLDANKKLLIVPDVDDDFIKGMVKNIGYFDEVITFDELEKEIIKNNKTEEVGDMKGKVGLHNISKKYKKFYYITLAQPSDKKLQLKLVNPETTDELFIAETTFDLVWSGVNDANTFNPLFNELIKYIENNSKIYKK